MIAQPLRLTLISTELNIISPVGLGHYRSSAYHESLSGTGFASTDLT